MSTFKNKPQTAFTVSVIAHAILFLALFFTPQIKREKQNSYIEMTFHEEIPIATDPLKNKANRLVEFDKTEEDKNINHQAELYAAKNNTVKKQTVAKLANEFKNVPVKKAAATTVAQEEKQEAKKTAKKTKKAEPKTFESQLFDNGFDVYSKVNEQSEQENQKRALANTGSVTQESTSADRIKEADRSLMTQLNTREYKYYGYYTRIRKQLNQWWEPKVREKVSQLVNKGRKLASDDNKNTSLIIMLNEQGTLVRIQVLSASGLRELDEAAIEAFKKAAPFPNPPKGLVEADGTIKIRWDFVVES